MKPVLACAALVLLVAARANGVTIDMVAPDESLRLVSLEVEAEDAAVADVVRDVVLTAPPPWYKPWERWRKKARLNRRLFESDLARAQAALREAGYYQAALGHDLTVDGDEVAIVLRVDAGPRTMVDTVTVLATDVGLTPATRRRLTAAMPLAPGAPFTQTDYDASRTAVEDFYAERGFAYARVAKAATVDPTTQSAAVTYTLTRGGPAVFGATTVEGLTRVAEDLVRREITWEPGARYDRGALEATKRRLYGLRLFRTVAVVPANLEARSGVVDVRITVTEGPPRQVDVGAGFDTEEGPRGQLRWQHNNWLGGGRQLGGRLKASLLEQTASAELRQPYFLSPAQTLIVPLIQGRLDEPGYTLATVSLAPRVERVFSPAWRTALGYTIEYDDVTDVGDTTIARLEEFEPRGFLSSINWSIERSTVDDLLDPHRGTTLTLTVEQAGGPWRGDYTFARGILDGRAYLTLDAGPTFAGRLRVGAGEAFGQSRDLPIFRRFYAGGLTSTRGYDRHRAGPLAGDDPVGGRSLIDGSVELRTRLFGDIGGVVFLDVGEVRRKPFSYSVEDLQFGAGVGVRYHTVVGPLRVDLGFPFEPPSGEPAWQIYFSVGQAF